MIRMALFTTTPTSMIEDMIEIIDIAEAVELARPLVFAVPDRVFIPNTIRPANRRSVRTMIQPLNYQQQNSSCWITSILNGLIFLLGSGNRIPNIVARLLYSISSRDGTLDAEAEDIAHFLDHFQSLPVHCRIIRAEEITPASLRGILSNGGIAVCDTLSGNHSVLVTGTENGSILVFDPDWENITTQPRRVRNAFECFPTPIDARNPGTYNVRVTWRHFFQKRAIIGTSRFCMGAVGSRFAVVIRKI